MAIDFLLSRHCCCSSRSFARSFPFSPPATPTEFSRNLSRAEDPVPYQSPPAFTNPCRCKNNKAPGYLLQPQQRRTVDVQHVYISATRDFGFRLGHGIWASTWHYGSRHGISDLTCSGGRSHRCRPIFFPKFITVKLTKYENTLSYSATFGRKQLLLMRPYCTTTHVGFTMIVDQHHLNPLNTKGILGCISLFQLKVVN